MEENRSIILNILGDDLYCTVKGVAKVIVIAGTCLLAVTIGLTFLVHWKFVSSILSLITGTSLLFLVYILAFVVLLDFGAQNDGDSNESRKTKSAFLIKVWPVILIILGVVAVILSNNFRKHYAFECETFLVDTESGIYHINYKNDCEEAAKAGNLIEMKGYEIEEAGYTFCEWCEEWEEEVRDAYNDAQYSDR